MRFARLLFAVAARGSSGAVLVDSPPARIEFVQGWIHALAFPEGDAARSEDLLLQLLPRATTFRYDETAPTLGLGRVEPFHPGRVLRQIIETPGPSNSTDDLPLLLGHQVMALRFVPHSSCLAPDEERLVALLDSSPQRWDDLVRAGVATPQRTAALLTFLLRAGALEVDVRATYLDLARELHPDLNSHLSDELRREREQRFRAVTEIYRTLAIDKSGEGS